MDWLQQPHTKRNDSPHTIIIKSLQSFFFLLFETLTELLSDFDVVPCDKHIKNDVFLNKKKLRTLFIIKKKGMKLLLGIFLFMKQKM